MSIVACFIIINTPKPFYVINDNGVKIPGRAFGITDHLQECLSFQGVCAADSVIHIKLIQPDTLFLCVLGEDVFLIIDGLFLPAGSIVFHVDQDDVFEVHKKIGHKFCINGGIPNYLLAYETPDQVRKFCKKVIDEVAVDGGYIMDASAIMQNEASIENVKAMTEFTRDYGVY